jgi:hypothetical protein
MDDPNYLEDSPEPRGEGPNVNNFKLSEAMMNKKHLSKAREDIKKIKRLMVEMQAYVQDHQIAIKQDMVDEDKLKITAELLENQMYDKIKREIQGLNDNLKRKIKKRLKMKHVDEKLNQKVNMQEFMKQVERIDNNVTVFGDKVEYRLPAMEYEFNRAIQSKAEISAVQEALDQKVDKTFVD